MSADILIYTKDWCPYCADAKALLNQKGANFIEIDLMKEPGRRDEMVAKAGGRTSVPQIFIGGVHVGGCDDLYSLESAGKLTPLLQG